MKKSKPLLWSLIFATFFLSCKEFYNNTKNEKALITDEGWSNNSITAKINGVQINFSETDSFALKGSNETSTVLTLLCSSTKGMEIEVVSINIYNYKGIGKYKIGKDEENNDELIPPIGSYTRSSIGISPKIEVWHSKDGQVEITEEKNGKIKGVFNFTTKKGDKQGDRINISEGKFSLKFST